MIFFTRLLLRRGILLSQLKTSLIFLFNFIRIVEISLTIRTKTFNLITQIKSAFVKQIGSSQQALQDWALTRRENTSEMDWVTYEKSESGTTHGHNPRSLRVQVVPRLEFNQAQVELEIGIRWANFFIYFLVFYVLFV